MLIDEFLCKREVLGKRTPHSFTPPSKCGRCVQQEIVVINDDEALNLNEMEMQSPTWLESERRDSMDVEVTEDKVCIEGCK
jgi:hypothetical protein